MDKPFVYDMPKVTTQKFKVSLPDIPYKIFVERKLVERQAHNTACGEADEHVDYDVWQEVPMDVWQKAVKAVEDEIEKREEK